MALQTSTAWQYADKLEIWRPTFLRLLNKIGAVPVGESVMAANGKKSKLYAISDLDRAAALYGVAKAPPAGVAVNTINEFAALKGINKTTILRHLRRAEIEPVGSNMSKNRKPAALYATADLERIALKINPQSGWSESHERTVRKHPRPERDKVCTGCGIKKHYTAFKRYTRGRYLKCEACREADKSFQPPTQGIDNKLCSAFLRGAL
jgi:hypothetical protein